MALASKDSSTRPQYLNAEQLKALSDTERALYEKYIAEFLGSESDLDYEYQLATQK